MKENKDIEVTCPHCVEKITISKNTLYCPRCAFDISENVEELFLKLDKIDNRGTKVKNTGKTLSSVGKETQEWGCTIFMLPFAFLSLLLLLSMCSAY